MFFKLKKILFLFLLTCATINIIGSASPKSSSELLATLTKQADEMYTKSSIKFKAPAPSDLALLPSKPLASVSTKKADIFPYCPPFSKPLLSQKKLFSEEWWNTLFRRCQGCDRTAEYIDCPKMLESNRQWQEVQKMDQRTKNIIMKNALSRMYQDGDCCNLACAICVGGDPDTRLENISPHTTMHIVSGANHADIEHFGLFELLLRKGANPSLECIPAHPLDFVPGRQWRDELLKYGSKKAD